MYNEELALSNLQGLICHKNPTNHYTKSSILISCSYYWTYPWCHGYHRRKWTRRYEFKSWTILIAFYIALIPLGKV